MVVGPLPFRSWPAECHLIFWVKRSMKALRAIAFCLDCPRMSRFEHTISKGGVRHLATGWYHSSWNFGSSG